MEVLKVWFIFACNSIAFLMGFNLIDWEVGLKIIGKIAKVFLALTVEGKLIINFMNCSWFDKQIDLWSQILIEQKREVTPPPPLDPLLKTSINILWKMTVKYI